VGERKREWLREREGERDSFYNNLKPWILSVSFLNRPEVAAIRCYASHRHPGRVFTIVTGYLILIA